MRYTVILVPERDDQISVFVPAMPGCVSMGRTRDEALANVREAIAGWMEVEAEQGRGPLPETPALILDEIAEAMTIFDEMRAAGELPQDSGYAMEIASIELQRSVAA